MRSDDPFVTFLEEAAGALADFPALRERGAGLREVAERAVRPFNVAIVGRMKTGKSTLINAIIGQEVAITDVEEATATINCLSHGTGAQTKEFLVHWKDGRTEPRPLESLQEWVGRDEAVRERAMETAMLQFFADVGQLKEFEIIDTPGTGSAVGEHEEIAQEFLDPGVIEASMNQGRKADAIVYVVGPVGRESDVDNLKLFESGRLPNSGAYNSVAVLHKWDGLDDPFTEARRKSARLGEQLGEKVAAVLPLSGPLALVARVATDEVLADLLGIAGDMDDASFEEVTLDPVLWDEDEKRANLYRALPISWASFLLVLKAIRAERPAGPPACRALLEEKSGIARLEQFLRERFFAQAEVIQRANALKSASDLISPAMITLRQECDRLEEDQKMLEGGVDPRNDVAARWLKARQEQNRSELDAMEKRAIDLDRQWLGHKSELEGLQRDLELGELLEESPDLFDAEDIPAIREMLESLARGGGRRMDYNIADIAPVIDRIRGAATSCTKSKQRALLEHAVTRVEKVRQRICEDLDL